MLVMLNPARGGTFRRVVRKQIKEKGKPVRKGEPLRTLTFEHKQPVELRGEDLAAVQDDLGHALVEVILDPKGRPRIVDRQAKGPEPELEPAGSAEAQ